MKKTIFTTLLLIFFSAGLFAQTAVEPTGSGTLTSTASGGVASFNDLWVDLVGTYSLTASADDLDGDTSDDFTITVAAAAQLIVEPDDLSQQRNVPFDVTVTLADAFGNPVESDGAVTITLTSENTSVPGAGDDGDLFIASTTTTPTLTLNVGESSVNFPEVVYTGLSDPDNGRDIKIIADASGTGNADGQTGEEMISVRDTYNCPGACLVSTEVIFVAGAVSASESSAEAESYRLAGGWDFSILTIILRDEFENTISGLVSSAFTIETEGIPADAIDIDGFTEVDDGRYEFEVTSMQAGTLTLTVKVTKDDDGEVTLDDQPAIEFRNVFTGPAFTGPLNNGSTGDCTYTIGEDEFLPEIDERFWVSGGGLIIP